MSEHIERMEKERAELKIKFDALWAFIDGDASQHLHIHQKNLLVLQYNAMMTYLNALDMRIENDGSM